MAVPAKASEAPGTGLRRVGVVGAGQLARMMGEAASPLDLELVVLAERVGEPACSLAAQVLVGTPSDQAAMRALTEACDVITFDHELVDLDILGQLEADGAVVRPSPSALRFACDKAAMRVELESAGIAIPRYLVLAPGESGGERFAEEVGLPLVVKTATGGYDGRGVHIAEDGVALTSLISELHAAGTTALLEELVPIERELAALVVRGANGEVAAWPAVETVQVDGMCQQVEAPGELPDALRAEAEAIARAVAKAVGLVGVMAVELFEVGGRLIVNELAMRPHNTGHWTIEGAISSQFENHLRAVLGLPLGSTAMAAPCVAMVNLLGPADGSDPRDLLPEALAVEGAHVHLYGKEARPGRKLGHVTTLGTTSHETLERAWQAAIALKSERKEPRRGAS